MSSSSGVVRPLQRLASTMDASVNLVFPSPRKTVSSPSSSSSTSTDGFIESRLVIRPRSQNRSNHISMYVSSHDGCTMGCAMCHLTATGQTSFRAQSSTQIAQQLTALCQEFHSRKAEAIANKV